MSQALEQIAEKLYDGDASAVAELTQQALNEGRPPSEVLNGGLVAGMDRGGVDFRNGELYVPEVLIAARAMHAGMDVLRPLLTTTMPSMKHAIDALAEADVRDSVKVMIGGAPVTQSFADEIGADGYAPDAAAAVELARSLTG
jgi:methanogenic corrinoid protein MtbC1